MITYFSTEVDNLMSGNRRVEYLPKWAKDEGLQNCDISWFIRKGFFFRHLSNIFG